MTEDAGCCGGGGASGGCCGGGGGMNLQTFGGDKNLLWEKNPTVIYEKSLYLFCSVLDFFTETDSTEDLKSFIE